MPTLSADQVYAQARRAGLNPAQAVIATAIAYGESTFSTTDRGDLTIQTATWGPSVGLWQIRSLKRVPSTGSDRYRDASRLTDPEFNAAAMYAISGKGTNWAPWSVYTSGTYKKYLSQAQAAGARVEGGGGGSAMSSSRPQAFALAEHNAPSKSWLNRCQEFVRTALGLGPGSGSAAEAYKANAARGTIYGGRTPPANVPVYFDTGPAGMGVTATDYDHVALSAGGGMVWSNDIRRSGQIDLVPISEIESKWGARYEGFGTLVNGTALPVYDAKGAAISPAALKGGGGFGYPGKGLVDKIPGLNQVDDFGDHAGALGGLALAPLEWVRDNIIEPGWDKLRDGAVSGAFVVLGIGLVWAGAASMAKSGVRSVAAKAGVPGVSA